MKQLSLLAVSLAMTAMVATAQSQPTFPTDGSTIVTGQTYDVEPFPAADLNAVLTPASSGTLIQYGCPDINIYTIPANEPLDRTYLNYGSYGEVYGQIYTYEVTEGVDYKLAGFSPFDACKVVFVMASDIKLALTEASPAEGSAISSTVNGAGDIILSFNTMASCSSAVVAVGSKEAAAELIAASGTTLVARIAQPLKTLFADGTLTPLGGEAVKVIFRGVKDASEQLIDGTGEITLDYITAPRAADLVSTNLGANPLLKSYYIPGSPEGIYTFTFDADLAAAPAATLSYGDPAFEGRYFIENITPEVQGNTITVDLTGRLRDISGMITEDLGNYVALDLTNVRDANGNLAEGQGSGAGSYGFSLLYKYIQPVQVASQFVPANGASLADASTIEIWFNNADKLIYDGIRIEYTDIHGLTHTDIVTDFTAVTDKNETTITLPVTDALRAAKNINVSLNNLLGLDGFPHEILARYDQFVATLVSPLVPGETYSYTGDDDFILLFNDETFGYYRYDFYNGNSESADSWAYGSWFTRQDDGTWTSYNGNYPCYADFAPYMLIRAYDSEGDYWTDPASAKASYTFTFKGNLKGFEYSSYEFVSIDPEPNTTITVGENLYFTVTFNGLVRLDPDQTGIPMGYGMGLLPFEKITPVGTSDEDPEGFASEWQLYPSIDFLTGRDGVEISIKAYDLDGKLIRGNMGGNEYDYLMFGYQVYSNSDYRSLNVMPADGASVEELYCFTLSAPGMFVTRNYNYTGTLPKITDRFGEIVYEFADTDIEIFSEITGYDENDAPIYDENSIVYLWMQQPVTIEGIYYLDIPEGLFDIGTQMDVKPNSQYFGTYHVGATAFFPMIVEPADGENLDEISQIIINTAAQMNPDCEEMITLACEELWFTAEWNIWSTYSNTLEIIKEGDDILGYRLTPPDGTITAPGIYTLTIPQGMFTIDGQANPATTYTYFLGGTSDGNIPLEITPADGTDHEILDRIEIRANGLAGINWFNYNPIAIIDQDFNLVWTIDQETMNQNIVTGPDGFTIDCYYIEPGIIAAGTYTLIIPAKFFEFENFGDYSQYTEITYTVKGGGTRLLLGVEPANGERLQEISEIIINTNAPVNDAPDYNQVISFTDGDGIEITTWTRENLQTMADDEGIYGYRLPLPATISAEGTYTLHIPADLFIDNGIGNSDMTLTYYIGQAGNLSTVDLTITPGDGEFVHALTRIDITAPDIEYAFASSPEPITITDQDNNIVYSETDEQLNIKSFDFDTFAFLGFYLEPGIETPGAYTLNIPEGFFMFTDMTLSKALVAVINVTGAGAVETIYSDNDGRFIVYSLTGVLILDTDDPAALRTLAPGIYIVNGRKHLVK